MHVTRFFGAGLARENGGERRLALAQSVESGDDIVESFEAIHALGAAAEFAGSLRAAKKKHAEDGSFATIEVEDFLEAVFVFRDAAVGSAGRTGKTFLLQRGEGLTDGIFVERRDGVAVIFLIASVYQSVQ